MFYFLFLFPFQRNYIYQSIKYGSGFGTDDTSPVAKWSMVKMLQNRQVNSSILILGFVFFLIKSISIFYQRMEWAGNKVHSHNQNDVN